MTQAYREQIIQTFRDQAIKSVLLVDDDFSPYEVLAKEYAALLKDIQALTIMKEYRADATGEHLLLELRSQSENITTRLSSGLAKFNKSGLAQQFTEFFHGTKRICDVEDKTDNLDYEKIRKSDLIILDYHLEPRTPNPAVSSLNLVSKLSDSKHLNMVVIFTKEPLDNVWLEVATALRGTNQNDANTYFDRGNRRLWNTNEINWLACWQLVFTQEEQIIYLSENSNFSKLNDAMATECRRQNQLRPKQEHIRFLIEHSLMNYNLINSNSIENQVEVHGKKGLWVQAGDVFIVLCDKFKDKNTDQEKSTGPEDVWDRIKEALLDWYPSFYRVVTSQLQNQIEDANLSMKKALAKDQVEQIAALWGINRNTEGCYNEAAKELLTNLLDDIFYKLQGEDDFIDFIENTANNAKDEPSTYIEESTKDKRETQLHIAHAYNVQQSSTQDFPSYITTGTIVKDEHNCWYLCVTPSCNTVPTQKVRDFTPHRQLTFAKLRLEDDLSEVLKKAHKSMHVFAQCPENGRLVFSTMKEGEDEVPNLMKVIVMDHDNGQWDKGFKVVTITKTKIIEGKPELSFIKRKFTPIARLRPAYAARFQNFQSHYEGRIGVDFASFNIDENPMFQEALLPELLIPAKVG